MWQTLLARLRGAQQAMRKRPSGPAKTPPQRR